ncbi:hypothetical protein TWF718_010855 [Orbilia javanica]|uniref:Uncharacterized protein n=1 Tax=Orbilia javanica TaxID=47235 RepID=A0AAN8RAA2_9PEZI
MGSPSSECTRDLGKVWGYAFAAVFALFFLSLSLRCIYKFAHYKRYGIRGTGVAPESNDTLEEGQETDGTELENMSLSQGSTLMEERFQSGTGLESPIESPGTEESGNDTEAPRENLPQTREAKL